ncbi:Flagellar hook-length control protein FliK [Rhodobacteraceae bacterium THAF1]|nr:Flagellar hook-length control protein FliK [Palleronia sp. THAF1]VDC16792.1 Flagellar hook-length control protein FliK [Rhodobacteraceae bacterium THAF1]
MPTLGSILAHTQPDYRTGVPKPAPTGLGVFGRVLDDLTASVGPDSVEKVKTRAADEVYFTSEDTDEASTDATDASRHETALEVVDMDADESLPRVQSAEPAQPDLIETLAPLIAPALSTYAGQATRTVAPETGGAAGVEATQAGRCEYPDPSATVVQVRLANPAAIAPTEHVNAAATDPASTVWPDNGFRVLQAPIERMHVGTPMRLPDGPPSAETQSKSKVVESLAELPSKSVPAPAGKFDTEVSAPLGSIGEPFKLTPAEWRTFVQQPLSVRKSTHLDEITLQRLSGDPKPILSAPTLPVSQLSGSVPAVVTSPPISEAQTFVTASNPLPNLGFATQTSTLGLVAASSDSQPDMQDGPSVRVSGRLKGSDGLIDTFSRLIMPNVGPSASAAEAPTRVLRDKSAGDRLAAMPTPIEARASTTRTVLTATEQMPAPAVSSAVSLASAEVIESMSGLASTDEVMTDRLPMEATVASLNRSVLIAPTSSTSSLTQPAVQSVAEAAVQLKNGQTEIALSPEELGRVSIRMTQTDGGLVVLLTVERDDTQALLRRHASDLADSLRAAGLGEAQIDFADRDDRKGEPTMRPSETSADFDPAEQDSTTSPQSRPASPGGIADRIDIRM